MLPTPPSEELIALLNEAAMFKRLGRFRDAQLICYQAIEKYPDDVNAIHITALVEFDLKNYEAAEALFIKTTELAPDFPQGFYNLGNFYRKRGWLKQAIENFKIAIALDESMLDAYKAIGDCYSRMNILKEAIFYYEQAVKIQPDPTLYNQLGQALAAEGCSQESEVCFRKALELSPLSVGAYIGLSKAEQTKFTKEEAVKIKSLIEKTKSEADRIAALFALSKAYDDIGEYDLAFQYLEEASLLRRKDTKYNPHNTTIMTDRLINTFSNEFLSQRKGFGCSSDAPIFVCAMPRSGSTLTEQILSSHSQIFGAGELQDIITVAQASADLCNEGRDFIERISYLTSEHCCALGELYIKLCQKWRLEDTPFFTDKLPTSFQYIGFIKMILPNAKIIHVYRNPIDNCFACYRVNFTGMLNFAWELKEIGQYYCDYWRLMKHWNIVFPGQIYNISYENLVNNQEEETKRLIAFCELPWEEQCLRFYENKRTVKTASSVQVRKPIFKSGVGRWKPYEKHLESLINTLKPILSDFSLD